MNGLDRLKQRTAEAYLAHRLDKPELLKVVSQLEAAEHHQGTQKAVAEQLDRFTEVCSDWHGKAAGNLDEATHYLGLDQQFSHLRQDRVWSPYQRAVYRRLSAPDNDPALRPEGRVHSGNAAFVKTALGLFDQVDSNHDGHLTPVELDQAMAGGPYTHEQSAALAILRRKGERLEHDKSGVTRQDLKAFKLHGIPGQAATTEGVNLGFTKTLERAAQMRPAGPLVQENFDAQGIFQAKVASCVMLSAGGAVGNLRGMFHDNHNGTVTVTFKDGVKETVKDLTDTERLYHSRTEEWGRWPGLLEMAMGQRRKDEAQSADGTARGGADYLPTDETLLAMTGKPGHEYSLDKMSPDATRKLLERLTQSGQPVICGSRDGWGEDDRHYSVESLHNGIVNNHEYTLLGYDARSDRVCLHNPWHGTEWTIKPDGQDDGTFSMPLVDFYCSFNGIGAPAAHA